jgi:hypothetical protein
MNTFPIRFSALMSALIVALLCLPARAAENPVDYPRQLPLQTEGQATWYRLEIPMSVYWSATHADLRDLRVFNAEDEALPYTLLPSEDSRSLREKEARLFALHAETAIDEEPGLRIQRDSSSTTIDILPGKPTPIPQQRLSGWLLDLGEPDFPLERLRLDWQGDEENDGKGGWEGFLRFAIEASDDLEHWRDWGEGQIVHMRFRGESIDQRDVPLPGQKARYLRLTWHGAQTLLLEKAQVFGTLSGHEPTPLIWSEPLRGQRADENEFIWRLPLELPLARVRIRITQPNTLAPVVLSGSARQVDVRRNKRISLSRPQAQENILWRTLARGVLYRLSENGHERAQEELELPGEAANQLRLQLDHRGGGLGNEPPELRVALRGDRLIFLARGKPPYRLALGRADAPSAALPLTTLIPGYDERHPPTFGLARLTETPTLPSADLAATPDQKKTGLWAVLLIGVILLVGMALSLLRASNKK